MIQARSSASGTCSATIASSLRERLLGVVVLGDPGAHPHHLGERPECDAVAVAEAPAAVPKHVAASPSTYVSNSQASRDLPMPGRRR